METVLLLTRLLLSGIFMLAGLGKLLDREGSEKAVKEFGLPANLAPAVAIGLPIAELVIGVLLLFTFSSWLAALAGLVLLFAFISGMVYQMAQGRAPDCHCFGQIHSEPVGKTSLIRNIGFAILALLLVAQGPERQGASLSSITNDMLQAILIFGILGLLAVAVLYLKKIFEQQVQILRRIEVLELVSRDGAFVEREGAGSPTESLPIGAPFPEFELADTAGKRVKFSDYKRRQRPLIFLFVSPECGPCNALYPELIEWREKLKDRVSIVLVSTGSISANLAKFDKETGVLLQEKRELAEKVKARWTPTAIYVDAEGRIASHPAAGDSAIRELLERVANEPDLAKPFVHFANVNGSSTKIRIGDRIPEFQTTTIDGREFTDESFKGRNALVVFFSLTCPHCTRMIEELKQWDETRSADDPELVVISDGDAKAHEELGLQAPIILDEGYKFATEIGMFGTPSAVLVRDGTIVTETGTGAPNIWALIGQHR